MPKKTFACLVATLAIAASTCVASGENAPATLTLHPDRSVSTVSPTLYGLMTEEINYSYDGGLYAEMVRNRTLRGDWSGILYWYLVEDGNARAKMSQDATTGPSTALPNSLKIEIEQADAHNQAGALNVGWWGMALHHNTEYKGSFYAKADSASFGPISVSIVNDDSGKAVTSATVNGVGTDWKQFTFTLKTGAMESSSTNHLVITAGHAGTLWLQLVSLFPPTYHDRANGNRVDLMDKLAAMHPAFLRLPGGNYLEGELHQGALRVEKDNRSTRRPANASQSVELSIQRRHGLARISGVVRGSAHAACARGICGILTGARARESRCRPRALHTRWPGRTRIRYRRAGYEVVPSARKTGTRLPSNSPTSKSATKIGSTAQIATTRATRSSLRPSRRSILTCS